MYDLYLKKSLEIHQQNNMTPILDHVCLMYTVPDTMKADYNLAKVSHLNISFGNDQKKKKKSTKNVLSCRMFQLLEEGAVTGSSSLPKSRPSTSTALSCWTLIGFKEQVVL